MVDIREALAGSEGLRDLFWRWMRWPEAPPFTGGVLDAWPAREAEGLSFARREWAMVRSYLKGLEVPHG